MADTKVSALTAASSVAETDLVPVVVDPSGTPASRKATLAQVRTGLGLVVGTDVQAHDDGLDDIAGLTPTDGNIIVGDGTNWVAESGSTARTSLGLGSIATQAANSVDIDGGAIDGVTIGNTTAATIANVDNLRLDGNTISSTNSNGDITITPNGTGKVAITKDLDVTGGEIYGFDASVNAQTGTTYTLVAGDNGKVVTLNNASAITVTVPSGLGAGFNCTCIQLGAGQVTFSPSSTTINNRQSHTKIADQFGVVSLVAYAADTFALAGDTGE